ncbi:17174_t:CDS:1, partial [Acaulospora morrowiae]
MPASPRLNDDLIIEIIQLLQDDVTSIYKCLLCCRGWCRLFVPVLWRRPFSKIGTPSNYKLLLRTYIMCFNEEELANLIP